VKRMRFAELRLACAELEATRAMAAEAEQAQLDADRVQALARRRVTQRPSRWSSADRELWARHEALQVSLRALRSECSSALRHVGRATTCPACVGVQSPHVGIG
jgi:hypothetical protein